MKATRLAATTLAASIAIATASLAACEPHPRGRHRTPTASERLLDPDAGDRDGAPAPAFTSQPGDIHL
jgi:hypothetical protein